MWKAKPTGFRLILSVLKKIHDFSSKKEFLAVDFVVFGE